MARWQRHARWGLAIIALAVIGAVVYTSRPREAPAPPRQVDRSDPSAVSEVHKGEALRLKGADRDVAIAYEILTTNAQNETKLRGVKISVSNRGGRNYDITGDECFIGKDNSSFDVRGKVKMVTSDGLTVTGQQATYVDTEKIVRVPGAVTFNRGRMNGTGVGLTYDEQRDIMQILENANVAFAEEGDQEAMAFTAGTFTYARRDRYMRLENVMHMDREAQQIDADNSTVRLFPDRDETDYVELRGGSKVTGGEANSLLKSMQANDINLDYADDGRTLQNATLAGAANILVASRSGSGTQRLSGGFMDISLDADGSVRSLSTREAVTVALPATKDTGPRTIRSNVLAASGTTDGIKDMKFSEGVEYREAAVKTQPARLVRARSLDAALNAAAGTLEEAHFTGNVDFTEGAMHATSMDARYNVVKGTLGLSGAGSTPHLDNDAITIDANAIDVTLNPRTMSAAGGVRSTLLPATTRSDTRRPALLADKDPVNIISDSMVYDENAHTVAYTGKVKLLQGDTTIQAATLTLDESNGNLVANGKVITNLMIASHQETPAGKSKPTLARAEQFAYADQTRTATYTTNAQLDSDQGNLTAVKLDLQLAKEGNTLERLEATGTVTALVDRRRVSGARLLYSPDDDKYVVTGAPVKMIDAECQETSGKTLTFWKASDRVQVDGNNEVRTQTKGGGKCVATPPQ